MRRVRSRIRKFWRLRQADQRLLLAAWMLLAGIRIGETLLSFATLQRCLARLGRPGRARAMPRGAGVRIAWAVQVSSTYVPGANICLTRALATHVWLTRWGHTAELRIGVRAQDKDPLVAHAWVESEGAVLIGGDQDLGEYRVLRPRVEHPS